MRKDGKSYKEISLATQAPKSTLSTWLAADFPFEFNSENQIKHLERIRGLARSALRNRTNKKTEDLQRKVGQEILTFPHQDKGFKKAILASLYWAEGAKTEKPGHLKFANTDPELMRYFLELLRGCYPINEKKIKVYIYVHYYHEIRKTKIFWSNLLNVPQEQFGKVYVKKRSKKKRFRKNSYGICYLNYGDTWLRKEIMETARRLPELGK